MRMKDEDVKRNPSHYAFVAPAEVDSEQHFAQRTTMCDFKRSTGFRGMEDAANEMMSHTRAMRRGLYVSRSLRAGLAQFGGDYSVWHWTSEQ